jgi:hypothetical protein
MTKKSFDRRPEMNRAGLAIWPPVENLAGRRWMFPEAKTRITEFGL